MIRLALFCGLVLTATYSTADDKKEVPKELMPFQGTWKVVKAELDGKELPAPEDARFKFAGNKLSIKEGKVDPEAGTYSVDSKKEPTEIDFISPKNEKLLGIYKFEKDGKLSISLIKDPKPRPKKFGGADTMVVILEKVKE
jgi:uncharacterized protein (TIGR03067 family)